MSDNCPIRLFFHCKDCLDEMPPGASPKTWSRTQTGITEDGDIIVWCNRHNQVVAPITEQLRQSLEGEECQCEVCKKEREDAVRVIN